jgi:hypothetical protein
MILHLGVGDVPYNQAPSPRQKKPRAGTVTTGDVAGWLENRYHVMEIFYLENQAFVAAALEDGLQGALESLLQGASPRHDPFGSGTSKIEDRFKQFLSLGEIDKLGIPGVPTQAAKDRASGKVRSPRFKNKRATGAAVSFIASGLYQTSFKAWVD